MSEYTKLSIGIPKLPKFGRSSPRIVRALDLIRFELDKKGEEYLEFYWFAREYPRFYRYHINNIEFRLNTIHRLYELHKCDFARKHELEELDEYFEVATSTKFSFQIYWEFEALLNAVNSALDLVARICGVAYEQQTPLSLNNITKKKELTGLVDQLRKAKQDWINDMKDYRDCFVHYTPVDNKVFVTFYQTKTMWKIWCKIPINPNIRQVDGFEFSKKRDLLKYSIRLYKNLMQLDKVIANDILESYKKQEFPKRIDNLFNIGHRKRN